MISFKNLIISESNSIDKDSGNLSVFNILNKISPLAFPVTMNRIVISIILERAIEDDGGGYIELLIKQEGQPDYNKIVQFSFTDLHIAYLTIRINGFVINGPGKIEFIAKLGETEIKNTISVVQFGIKI